MTAESLDRAAAENLKATYLELGAAASNSRIWTEPGFTACVGDFDHPICNFAAGLDLTKSSAMRLARIALDRSSFNIYVTPQDRPDGVERLLASEGFSRSFQLGMMAADPEFPEEPRHLLSRASTYYDRFQIAAFMVDQFFTKQGHQFRRPVADATAKATNLELLSYKRGGRIVAAAMISLNAGITGVYNVCVDSSLRSMGVGSALVREILAVCSQKKLAATLQCDPKLEPWYNQFGFKRRGTVEVLTLPRPSGLL